MNPNTQITNTMKRYLFIGLIISHRIKNPTTDNKYVLAVPISTDGNSNNCANITSAAIVNNDVNAAGKDLINVLFINLPSCFYSLGSKASKNAGIPILNIDTNDTWFGSSG